jgi:hypothetical protein
MHIAHPIHQAYHYRTSQPLAHVMLSIHHKITNLHRTNSMTSITNNLHASACTPSTNYLGKCLNEEIRVTLDSSVIYSPVLSLLNHINQMVMHVIFIHGSDLDIPSSCPPEQLLNIPYTYAVPSLLLGPSALEQFIYPPSNYFYQSMQCHVRDSLDSLPFATILRNECMPIAMLQHFHINNVCCPSRDCNRHIAGARSTSTFIV